MVSVKKHPIYFYIIFFTGLLFAEGSEGTDVFFPPFWLQEALPADAGSHVEACGPFFESRGTQEQGWVTFRPFYYSRWNKPTGQEEFHFLYPLANRYQKPNEIRADFMGLIRQRVSRSSSGVVDSESMFFPIYFSRDSGRPETSYQGIMPLGGEIKHVLGCDRMHWVMFPLYLSLEKSYETRSFMPWPFIQWLDGPESRGFALWPIFGTFERKGHYQHDFALWPLIYDFQDDLFKPIPRIRRGVLPFYAMESSENLKRETWFWPFFGYIDQKNPAYYETQYFWPLLVQGSGEGHYVNRWAPVYTYSSHAGRQKKWILWPIAKMERWEEEDLVIERSQGLYFIIWHEAQNSKNPAKPFHAEKTHVWPLLSYRDNGQGAEEFQLFSPLDVFFPYDEVVRTVYNPLFALFRYKKDAAGNQRQSFLFNTIVFEKTPEKERFALGPLLEWEETKEGTMLELFMGLIGIGQKEGKNVLKLFWISLN